MFGVALNVARVPKRRLVPVASSHRRIALKKYFFFTMKPTEPQRSLCLANVDDLKPEVVLSSKNRRLCAENLKRYRPGKKSKDDVSKAAVLVPLCTYRGQLGLLYTLRSTKINTNRGQVSFPGGMQDQADRSLEETALRETWEELHIPKEKIDVWTSASPIGRRHVSVLPVLGYIGEVEPEKLHVNPQEVEEAFVLTLEKLCDPSLCRFTQFRDSFTLPTYLGGKHRIWGLTAAVTHMIMNALVPTIYKHKLNYLQPIDHASKDEPGAN